MGYQQAVTNPVAPPEHGSLVRAIRALPNPLTYDDGRKALLSHVDYVRKHLPGMSTSTTELKNAVKNARATANAIEDFARRLQGYGAMTINERARVVQFVGSLYGEVSAHIGISQVVVTAREEFVSDVVKGVADVGKKITDAAATAGKLTLFFGALIPYLPMIAIAVAIFLEVKYQFFTRLLGAKVKRALG